MILCGWRTGGRRSCEEPGTVLVWEGPRFLCEQHAAALKRLREARRREVERWRGWHETTAERAARLRMLG